MGSGGITDQVQAGPAADAFVITPSDTVNLPFMTRGVYVGAAGTLIVIHTMDVASVSYVGVQTGTLLPIAVRLVYSTGTTAGSLLGLF